MRTVPDIPQKYPAAACIALTSVSFFLGGTALERSTLYGDFFLCTGVVLLFLGVYTGRKDPS